MLPAPLTKTLGPGARTIRGLGTVWYKDDPFSEGTFAHGAASAAILRIDMENNLIVSMTRNTAGTNFNKYKPLFLQAVADAMVDLKGLAEGP